MKVLDLMKVGELVLEERETPVPGKGEVLLKVRACGICSSDEARIFTTGTYHFPTVPGHEFAGEVVKVGEGVDGSLIGKRASVFPLLPCKQCSSCKKEDYATCSDYKYFGSRNDGGFSEFLAVPVWNLNFVDDSVSFETAALSEPAAVAHHAVKASGVKPGDKAVVVGSGAIGILMAYFLKKAGGDVYVAGRRKEALEFIESLGFKTIDVKDMVEEVNRITGGERMDIAIEGVGSSKAFADCIMSLKPGGTLVAVGNPHCDFELPKDIYWKILRWQLNIKGTWNSAYGSKDNDWKAVAEAMKDHDFPFEKLITEKYTLDQSNEAMDRLRDKSRHKARLMFVMDGEM